MAKGWTRVRAVVVAVVAQWAVMGGVRAGDWPQWLGEKRDGVWREQGTVERFPASGAKVKWRAPVKGGYAGAAVAGGRVYVMDFEQAAGTAGPKDAWDRKGRPGVERVVCLDEQDGKPVWVREYPVEYTVSYGSGPRATPVVEGERVYTLGAEGHVHCLDARDGKVIWSKRGKEEGVATPVWGFAGHPLIDGEKLIVLTAGRAVTAFDKKTGEVLWQSLAVKEPGYAPPMIYTLGGKRTLIVWHPEAVNGLDPETGSLWWTHKLGPVKNGVSIPTPVVELGKGRAGEPSADRLFVTSSFTGGLMLKFEEGKETPGVAWHEVRKEGARKGDALHTLMANPVFKEGHIYGVDFYGQVICVDASSGKRLWETLRPTMGEGAEEGRMWATAFLTPAGGEKFFLANDQGEVIAARMSPKGYEELSRAKVLEPTNRDANTPVVWCAPAYANGAMFWRNDKELVCVSLKE